jgi:hypothetical protein
MIFCRKDSKSACIGVPACRDHVAARHEFRIDSLCQKKGHTFGYVIGGERFYWIFAEKYRTAERLELLSKCLQESGLAGSVGTDQSEDLPRPGVLGDIPDDGAAVISGRQVFGSKR